jgi:uncharacterized membrane protein
MIVNLLQFINVLSAGLLAGEEFVIRYGARGPIADLDQAAHIQLRQALIRTLRVLVPGAFGIALLSGIADTLLGGSRLEMALRCGGLFALVCFISITLGGTVPINEAVLNWNPASPPTEWRALIERWERLDTLRTWAAIAAFCFFVAAVTMR